MQTAETIDLINAVEERFPVETWTLGDLKIWPLVRFELYMLNANHSDASQPGAMRRSRRPGPILRGLRLGKSIADLGRIYLCDRARNASPAPAAAVFLSNGIACTRLPRGWQDNICDPAIRILREEGIRCFLMNSSRSPSMPRLTPSMFVRPQLDYAALRARSFAPARPLPDEYKDFERFLRARDTAIVVPEPASVCRKATIIEARSGYFLRLFRTLRPLLGLQVCYYGGLGLAFNLACHRYGIPSVDLQHGVQGELHFAYGRWNRVPADGYPLLSSVFWCWSRSEADAIAAWSRGVAAHRAIAGGNLFLQSWREETELTEAFDRRIRELKKRSGQATHVLYTLRDNDAEAELAEVLELARTTADSHHWWVRLHPMVRERAGEVERHLRSQGLRNFEVAEATSLPLYVLLRHVDLHVTGRSTTVIEAERLGVPSVLIDPEGVAVYAELVRSGWALPAHGREEMVSALQEQRRRASKLPRSGPAETAEPGAGRRALLTLIEECRALRRSRDTGDTRDTRDSRDAAIPGA